MNVVVQPVGIYPRWLAIATNWVCDSKCQMCKLWQTTDKTFLDYNVLQHGVRHSFFDGIRDIALFGGEPTRHDKLPEIISVLKDRFPWADLSIVTNGIDKDRILDIFAVISEQITKDLLICVSINGAEARHDQTRGVEGSYRNALKVIRGAQAFFRKKPRISMTLLPNFTDELEHLHYLTRTLEVDASLRVAVSGSYFKSSINTSWTPEQINHLEVGLVKLPKVILAHQKFADSLPQFLRSGKAPACQAHRLTLIVSPNMDTSVCHNLPSLCKLEAIPDVWGKCPKWYSLGTTNCFKGRECYFDGPYSVSLLGDI